MSEDTNEIDDRAKSSKEILAFPNEIPQEITWSPEADMLMQINEGVQDIGDSIDGIHKALNALLILLTQAAETAGEYIAKTEKE